MIRSLTALVVSAVVLSAPATAMDTSFMGRWTVTSSQPAPWSEAGETPVRTDLKALIGKTVVFQPTRIVAPTPLGCRKPSYAMKSYGPDMLFQGGLHDPAREARDLGFKGKLVPTLETGCEGAIDFHFVDLAQAEFALNNRIYFMRRSDR